jgi:hypothetical protein
MRRTPAIFGMMGWPGAYTRVSSPKGQQSTGLGE